MTVVQPNSAMQSKAVQMHRNMNLDLANPNPRFHAFEKDNVDKSRSQKCTNACTF
jgi:hypothetical protein